MKQQHKQRKFGKKISLEEYDGNCEISNLGRFKNENGEIKKFSNIKERYFGVSLKLKSGSYKRYGIHRLVALHFCEIPKKYLDEGIDPKTLIPNHINGIKHCNAAFNLEWSTHIDNCKHAWATGLCNSIQGESNHMAKITDKCAKSICDLIMQKKSNKEISEKLNVTKSQVQHIRSGETWKHIAKEYTFPKLAKDKKYTVDEKTIHSICKMIETKKYTDREIGNKYGLSREYIKDIRLRYRRKDISQKYNF